MKLLDDTTGSKQVAPKKQNKKINFFFELHAKTSISAWRGHKN
jgi:hypothetical protein